MDHVKNARSCTTNQGIVQRLQKKKNFVGAAICAHQKTQQRMEDAKSAAKFSVAKLYSTDVIGIKIIEKSNCLYQKQGMKITKK
jgi:hypothetical protein